MFEKRQLANSIKSTIGNKCQSIGNDGFLEKTYGKDE